MPQQMRLAGFKRPLITCWRTDRTSSASRRNAGRRAASTSWVLDLQSIDAKWQARWAQCPTTQLQPRAEGPRKKFYVLPMFPYPSGNLHMGHLRVYTISDAIARFKRMQGCDVIHPIGWDAFGLPAENAAIERGIDPAEWTKQNIKRMKEQLCAMGVSFDWDRASMGTDALSLGYKELTTSDPSFYKHTQRIFLLLHQHGLAYQAEALVNYDPVDRTVLANEQVDAEGFSWRSGAKVEKINLKQWFLKITEYQSSLLQDLELLGQDQKWPERVISQQAHWLGKSEGAKFRFPITTNTSSSQSHNSIEVFTTRPDTLFGVQYLALSSTHPIVTDLVPKLPDLQAFLDEIPNLPFESKAGFLLPGIFASNPLSLVTGLPATLNEALPVYVAPYVVGDYGEGAVMGVPGHDMRDHDFWRHNRGNEKIRNVIESPGLRGSSPCKDIFTHHGILASSCGRMAGLDSSEASKIIISELENAGGHAKAAETWRLRDWLISRQRYWGTPIPIIHCKQCGAVPVPLDQLPVELPRLHGECFKSKGGNPLETAEDWVNTDCPRCGNRAKRDTDTMDTFMDSAWYFMRFADPHNDNLSFSALAAESYLPVDLYVGGVEHAILHLLYARFISKFLTKEGFWPSGRNPTNRGEPFRKLLTQGMVHGKTYTDLETGRPIKPDKQTILTGKPSFKMTWEKMSKSKHNGVDPAKCLMRNGADATKAYILFQAPVADVIVWEETRIAGIKRWFTRLWKIMHQQSLMKGNFLPFPQASSLSERDIRLWTKVQDTISSVKASFSTTFALNTIISDLIKLTNLIHAIPPTSCTPETLSVRYHATKALLRMLAPIAPAVVEECWERLHDPGRGGSMSDELISSNFSTSSSQSDNDETLLATSPPRWDPTKSIFTQPFPTIDEHPISYTQQQNMRQRCVIQENGKLRFAIDIEAPPPKDLLVDSGLTEWLVRQIEESDEGKAWLARRAKRQGKAEGLSRGWKRIVVVKRGKTINFVGLGARKGKEAAAV